MATTRRPQLNHKACSHAATPKARKACRKAHRAASDFTTQTTEQIQAMRANLVAHPSSAAAMLVIDIDAELATRTTPAPNFFQTASSRLTHALCELPDGTLAPACSKRPTKGEALHREGWYWAHATCNKCSGVAANNRVGR